MRRVVTGGVAKSRTGERADRDGAVDDLCEGGFRLPFPLAPARPESHKSKGLVGPSRRLPADHLGYSTPTQRLEQAVQRGE
jgi:hypothetical protein